MSYELAPPAPTTSADDIGDAPRISAEGAGFRAAVVAAGIALLGIVLFVPTLQSPFVYDDLVEVVGNASIRDLKDVGRIVRAYPTRPLTNLSYALDFARTGLNPFAYHVTNVLLHGLNIILVFWLVRWLVIRTRGSAAVIPASGLAIPLITACLFAVHPVQTEAVTYVSGRAEVLSTTFFLAAVLCFGYGLASTRWTRLRWMALAVAGLVASLGAKEVAIVLPVVIVAYDWIVLRGDAGARRRFWRWYAPLFAVAFVVGSVRVWRYVSLEQAKHAGLQWHNALLELYVLFRYVKLLFVPRSLSLVPLVAPLDSLLDLRLVIGAATLLICLGIAVAAWRRERLVTFGMLWFLVTLVPSSIIVFLQAAGHSMAEHRLYLPSVGFFLCVAAVASRLFEAGDRSRRRLVAVAVATGVVAALATGTLIRHRAWRDSVSIWRDAASKAPGVYMAQYGLAEAYRNSSDCANAVKAYQRAMQIRPTKADPYIGYAWCLLDQGQPARARDQLELAVLHAPTDIHANVSLAVVEGTVFGDSVRAADICRTVLRLAPRDPEAADCERRAKQKVSP